MKRMHNLERFDQKVTSARLLLKNLIRMFKFSSRGFCKPPSFPCLYLHKLEFLDDETICIPTL